MESPQHSVSKANRVPRLLLFHLDYVLNECIGEGSNQFVTNVLYQSTIRENIEFLWNNLSPKIGGYWMRIQQINSTKQLSEATEEEHGVIGDLQLNYMTKLQYFAHAYRTACH